MHLLQAAFEQDESVSSPVNEDLINELAATLFNSGSYQNLSQPCDSRQQADDIEEQVALKLAETYQQLHKRQQEPLVQQLNRLL